MKKMLFLVCVLPILISAQEISINGNRGMFRIQYAQPHNMGMFSFHLAPEWRFESFDVQVQGSTPTDRRHFFQMTAGLSYAIIDFFEIRTHATVFTKYYEANDYPIDRDDPYPPIGIGDIEIGGKFGYPFYMDRETPFLIAVGVDGHVNFGPHLSTDMFSNAWNNDRALYADTFDSVVPNFPPYVPHDPDWGFSGLFDFRAGSFAAHLNAGYLITGDDINPGYVDSTEFARLERPNYMTHGFGIELIPSDAARIMFEVYGMLDSDASEESLWVTPGIRFGSRNVSFDVGCEFGIVSPSDSAFWKAFFNISTGVDLVKKVEVHIPIAKVSGKVYDAKTGEPVAATITFPESEKEPVQAQQTGAYEITFTPGSYRMHIEAPNYRWKEKGLVLKDGDQVILDFSLNRKPVSKIIGKIYDMETKLPIVAEITFPQTNLKAISSDTSGMFNITLPPGTYRVHAEATNYQFNEKVATLREDETKVVDIALTKIGLDRATLTGKISEIETGKPLLAQISFIGTNFPKATTDPSTGIYKITIPSGTYSTKAEAADYVPESAPVVLGKNETKIQNFTLRPVPKVGEKVVLKGIYFDFNSSVIKPTSYPVLDDAAKVLKAKPKMRVEIGGHTDSIGSDAYNLKLSRERANSVRAYMIRYHNIDPSRLIAVGYGEAQSIADNRTKSGRDMNRRIEFKILSW